MAVSTYDLLDSVTLSSSASSVTFSSISQDYRDLVLVVEASTSAATNPNAFLRLNGNSDEIYSAVRMTGNGTIAGSGTTLRTEFLINGYSITSTKQLMITNIMDYVATDKHTSILVRSNRSDGAVEAKAGRWANTSAITSLVVSISSDTFNAGSTFYLYGVAA